MYNMIPYKSKVIHVKDDIINFSAVKQNINYYPKKKTTVVMTSVWFFYITNIWVTPSSLVI